MFAEFFNRVLQYRAKAALKNTDKAVQRLNKSVQRLADATNALTEYQNKMLLYGKGISFNDVGANQAVENQG